MNSAKRMNWDIRMTRMIARSAEATAGSVARYAVALFGTCPTLMTNRFRSAR